MTASEKIDIPRRVTDLIELKKAGRLVTCNTSFEIVPVDFRHRANPFRAYIFLCRYSGKVDGKDYVFRKCYARGCPHNLCPHVAQAVMIANRYLQRDYRRLQEAGLSIDPERLFQLEEMLVKFGDSKAQRSPVAVIHDIVRRAKEEQVPVNVTVDLEWVPAVEHFAREANPMVFLMVQFRVSEEGKETLYERCLACYPEEDEGEEKAQAVRIANERLKGLYQEFDAAGIRYAPVFFE